MVLGESLVFQQGMKSYKKGTCVGNTEWSPVKINNIFGFKIYVELKYIAVACKSERRYME